jgi:hypothetical protein
MFAGVTTTAILVAFIADLLLSRRFTRSAGVRRVRHLRNHVVVVGLGSFGIRVVSDLSAAGYDVSVIERDENSRFLSSAAELDVPVIFGDATLRQTLESACIDHARAVAVLTQDDMVNIETGIVLREMLGARVIPQVNDAAFRLCCAYTIAHWEARWRSGSVSKASDRPSNWRQRGSSAPQWVCRCRERFRSGNVPSRSAECMWRPAANSTGC